MSGRKQRRKAGSGVGRERLGKNLRSGVRLIETHGGEVQRPWHAHRRPTSRHREIQSDRPEP